MKCSQKPGQGRRAAWAALCAALLSVAPARGHMPPDGPPGQPPDSPLLPARETPCVEVHQIGLQGDEAPRFAWLLDALYEAIVEMKTPDGEWKTKTVGASNTPQNNTMFPKDWDAQRVQVEIESAWARRTPVADKPNMWSGTSDSGIKIQGYLEPGVTAFPARE